MKALAITMGLITSILVIFFAFNISSLFSEILTTNLFDENFYNLPFYLYSSLIFLSAIIYFLVFFYFSKIFLNTK